MSRFVKVYPGEVHDDCSIAITEIDTESDVNLIKFECFKIRTIEAAVPARVTSYRNISPGATATACGKSSGMLWLTTMKKTIDIEQAQPFLTGYIDDNGTSEIRFETQPVFILNRSYAALLGKLLNRLYDIAKELIPYFVEPLHDQDRERQARQAADDDAEQS